MRYFITLLFLGLIWSITVQAQSQPKDSGLLQKKSYTELDSLREAEHNNANFENAAYYAEAGREKAKKELGTSDSTYAAFTANLGYEYVKNGQMAKAEPLLIEAVTIFKKVLGIQNTTYAISLRALGALYHDMGDYEKAELIFLDIVKILSKTVGDQHPEYAGNLNDLASLYLDLQNYERAEIYYLQTKSIYEKNGGEENEKYAICINNIAALYQQTGDKLKAEQYFLKAKDIWAKLVGENHPNYAGAHNNLGDLYRTMGLYEKSEKSFLKTKDILAKTIGDKHPYYALTINNLALLYKNMKDYKKAEQLYSQSKKLKEEIFGKESTEYASSLVNLAYLYKETNRIDSAYSYCLQALDANSPEIGSNFSDWENLDKYQYYSNPSINRAIDILLYVLEEMYDKTGDKSILKKQYLVNKSAIRLNEKIRNNFIGEKDKLRSLATNHQLVVHGIKAGLRLKDKGYEEELYTFSEMNKAVLLMDAAKNERAYRFGDLPDSLEQREKALQKEYNSLKARLTENLSKEDSVVLRSKLNKVHEEVIQFSKILKAGYPKYNAIKYEHKVAAASEIQAILDEKTALIEFVSGDSALYIFYLDKKQLRVFEKNFSKSLLKKDISELHQSLSDYDLIKTNPDKAYQQFTSTAWRLYKELLSDVLGNAKGIKQLIIIPDGELAHLPFEVFLTKEAPQKGNYADLPYLIRDYAISYNYSATLWKENKESKHNKNNGLLFAVAANYETQQDSLGGTVRSSTYRSLRDALKSLPAARQEVENLQKHYGGTFAFDKSATELNFKAKAADFGIIHLAMHGLLNEKSPILSSLAFTEDGDSVENNFLQAYEISKMQLNADLVVLSACETGFGKFEKGNGTASLARAFMYAGVPSMVVSLWQVNDASTSAIMQFFYKNLAKGMDKAEALRQAKLEYIKTVGGGRDAINRVPTTTTTTTTAHPAYWAAFIQIGDSRPLKIVTKNSGLLYWAIGAICLLALGGAVYVMRSRKK